MRRLFLATVAATVIVMAPRAAYAQVFLTPYAGATFGGDAPGTKLTTGASVTFMGRAAGLEVDFGYTPDFFGEHHDLVLISNSNLSTIMGNLVIGPGRGPVRPFVLGGVGLMRTRINVADLFDDVHTNSWGVDAGAGMTGGFSHGVGVRGDVRYFRRVQDPNSDNDIDVSLGHFNFWRATAGVALKF